MKTLLPGLLLCICASAAEDASTAESKKYPMLPPDEAIKTIVLPPGYKLECVASEPMIREPVFCAWDGNGRMYVLEMRSYMQDEVGTGTKEMRNGRVILLEDTDGDGRMDKSTVYADNLLLPRMILPLDERIVIQETDDTSFYALRDTNGDGVSDEKNIFWKGGKNGGSVEHQDSCLIWNVDNWMYTAQGHRRYRFTRGKIETQRLVGEFNQWGVGMDDTGRMYYTHNNVPGRSFQQHYYYWSQIGERVKWGRFERPELGADTDAVFQKVYAINDMGDRGGGKLDSWTACTGVSIYRGDALPKEVNGDFFLCEPCGHLVRRGKVSVKDGMISLNNAYEAEKKEFIASTDMNFRPVSTHTGPDGCLYIVDMYRGIIQDAPWVDENFRKLLRETGLRNNRNHGRIYRVVHESQKPGPRPHMLDQKPTELVAHLAHANGWWRDTAQKLILVRGDKSVIPSLKSMAQSHSSPLARLHALWTLEGLDALEPDLLREKLKDADARVRAAAVRNFEPRLMQNTENDMADKNAIAVVSTLAGDPDMEVKRQVILSLGVSKTKESVATIEKIVEENLASEIIFLGAMTALFRRDVPLVEKIMDGGIFRKIKDPSERVALQRRWKSGLAGWQAQTTPPKKLDADTIKQIDTGYQIYTQLCIACHGPNGKGVQQPGEPLPMAPPLVGAPRLLGAKEATIRILLQGLAGPVDGKNYQAGQMPAVDDKDDAWVAAVLTYVRQEWSNMASPVRAEDVARVRAALKPRKLPWKLEELANYNPPKLANKAEWKATANGNTFIDKPFDDKRGGGYDQSWHGSNDPNCWYALDLGRPHTISKLVLDSFYDDRCPRAFKVSISSDGKTWTDVETGKGDGFLTTVTFEPVLAQHVKITMTARAPEPLQFSEIDVYGVPADTK